MPLRQEPEAVVKPDCDVGDAQRVRSGRGQLDGKREAVELPAHAPVTRRGSRGDDAELSEVSGPCCGGGTPLKEVRLARRGDEGSLDAAQLPSPGIGECVLPDGTALVGHYLQPDAPVAGQRGSGFHVLKRRPEVGAGPVPQSDTEQGRAGRRTVGDADRIHTDHFVSGGSGHAEPTGASEPAVSGGKRVRAGRGPWRRWLEGRGHPLEVGEVLVPGGGGCSPLNQVRTSVRDHSAVEPVERSQLRVGECVFPDGALPRGVHPYALVAGQAGRGLLAPRAVMTSGSGGVHSRTASSGSPPAAPKAALDRPSLIFVHPAGTATRKPLVPLYQEKPAGSAFGSIAAAVVGGAAAGAFVGAAARSLSVPRPAVAVHGGMSNA